MAEEESSGSGNESEMKEAWNITDNIVSGCVQYFVPGKFLSSKLTKEYFV